MLLLFQLRTHNKHFYDSNINEAKEFISPYYLYIERFKTIEDALDYFIFPPEVRLS